MLFISSSCDKQPDNAESKTYTLAGKVEKGPFVNGSELTIQELDYNLKSTGRIFNETISSDDGGFNLGDFDLVSPYVLMTATGYFYNEVSGELSNGTLRLQSIVDLTSKESSNLNIITHLMRNRILKLISSDEMLFSEAYKKAQYEVLENFSLHKYANTDAALFSIAAGTEESAALVVLSSALISDRTIAEFTEHLALLATQFSENGTLTATQREDYYKRSSELPLDYISEKLIERYKELKINITVKDLNNYIDWDKDGEVGDDFNPETPPSIKITNINARSTSVQFTITPSDKTIRYEYFVAKTDEKVDMIVVENGEPNTITVDNLEENALYEIRAIAYGMNENKSAVATYLFKAIEGGEVVFFRRVLALVFTGQWSVNSPLMTTVLNTVRADYSGVLNTIAVHLENGPYRDDDLEITEGVQLYAESGVNGIPMIQIDYREMCSVKASILNQAINVSINDYAASSTVAIRSEIEDKEITIEVKAKFAETGNYKIGCVITENNVIRDNTKGSVDGLYHNVLRCFLTDAFGDDIGEMNAGQEVTRIYTVNLDDNEIIDAQWNVENLNVVAFIMKNHGNGNNYVNNSAECKANGSVDFS